MTLDDIKREIESAESIVILTHEYPDRRCYSVALLEYIMLCAKWEKT